VSDVVVIGGGVIGLASAWRAAVAGAEVTVCDPEPCMAASWAAAGMLAPVTESRAGSPALTALGVASLHAWADFARQLEEFSGCPVGLRTEGTLAIAFDAADRRALEHLAGIHRQLGLTSRPLTGGECRQAEPLLSHQVTGGLDVPGDHQVDNRLVVAALQSACAKAGVSMVPTRAASVEAGGTGVRRVVLEDGAAVDAGAVVLAAGCWSGRIVLPPSAPRPPVRPVKGQIMRLRAPAGSVPARIVRGLARGVSVYLVPRESGQVVVGGTVEEQGFDTSVTAGAVFEMLRAATEVVPATAGMTVEDVIARLRPATPDDGPIIGPSPVAGLIYATGHHRNGVLMTPLTAAAVAGCLAGEAVAEVVAPFGWERFAGP
jgi:glycine oxidase